MIALFILPLFVKNLGAELYGIWVISGVIIGYLGILDLGFSQGVMKYISEALNKKDQAQFSQVFSSSTALFLLIGAFIGLIIFVFNERLLSLFAIAASDYETARSLLKISAFFAPLFWTARITSITFQGALHFKAHSILSGVQSLGRTMSMLYMVYSGYDIVVIAIVCNTVQLILWLPSIIVLKRMFPRLLLSPKNVKINVIRRMIPFSLGVFYASLTSMLGLQLDNLIIGAAISMSAVTAYAVASKLFNIGYQYMGLLSGVLQPTSYHAYANNDKLVIEKIMERGTSYMSMLYSSVGYMGIIISPIFIGLWMGAAFLQYAIWSQAFMLLIIITSGTGLPINLVFNSGRTKPPNVVKTIGIIVNLTVSISLVKYFGIGGPIIGTLAASLIGLLTYPYFCKLLDFNWQKYLFIKLKITIINIPATVFFFWVQNQIEPTWANLILILATMSVVFFGTFYFLIFTHEMKEDLSILLAQIKPRAVGS